MQAIIMAGGKGQRLRPYTAILPKPLMPIGEIPILEVTIEQENVSEWVINGVDGIQLKIF